MLAAFGRHRKLFYSSTRDSYHFWFPIFTSFNPNTARALSACGSCFTFLDENLPSSFLLLPELFFFGFEFINWFLSAVTSLYSAQATASLYAWLIQFVWTVLCVWLITFCHCQSPPIFLNTNSSARIVFDFCKCLYCKNKKDEALFLAEFRPYLCLIFHFFDYPVIPWSVRFFSCSARVTAK